ncbi:MAG: ATP-dependent DNA helicase RecG [Lachnospiraceae bacterium]|nr:ATP-dependent DNA helicase RecG [Lachnospiraceae bacterium]
MKITDSVIKVKGIGQKSAKLYEKLDIRTVGDLLCHFPRGYERYDMPVLVSQTEDGTVRTVEGILTAAAKPVAAGSRRMIVARIRDISGEMDLRWFNSPFVLKQLPLGRKLLFRGKISRKGRSVSMVQPEIYTEDAYRARMRSLRPVYSLTAGLSHNAIAKAVSEALAVTEIPDSMPQSIRRKRGFLKLEDAYRAIHCPEDESVTKEAIKRLSYDEFTRFLLSMRHLKAGILREPNSFLMEKHTVADGILAALPYELTAAQKRVLAEIIKDLCGAYPMQRLLQGDVGSGKTVIALLALAMCAEEGISGCLMAPTEVLARQHFAFFTKMLAPFGIGVALLVGSQTKTERKRMEEGIVSGEYPIVIGTHALFQDSVEFPKLGLVIVDEQHRFGVKQREQLMRKGEMPHLLIMSATPIPRTLAMMLYGDMDISLLDEQPAERLPVKTCVVDRSYRPTAYRFIKEHAAKGEQTYVICPLIEESEDSEGENVTDYARKLREEFGDEITVGTLHGQMNGKDKNAILSDFAEGKISVLVSTTVVEVGINVPNATIIMVENAERFGLSALHQLRGRVGRGAKQSYCILMQGNESEETKERLSVLLRARNGFAIAEEDLKLRGPGDFFGIRQSGDMDFAVADIIRDADMLAAAKEDTALLSDEEAEERFHLLVAERDSLVVY